MQKYSRPGVAFSVAAVLFVVLAAGSTRAAQQPPAGTAPPAQGARGGVRGPAPVNTLGSGPWDLGAGRGRIHVSLYAKDLDHPWGIAFLPDGGMLVTERPGRLRVIRNGVLDPAPIGPLPAMLAVSLGGLLDVSLHPRFAENHLISTRSAIATRSAWPSTHKAVSGPPRKARRAATS